MKNCKKHFNGFLQVFNVNIKFWNPQPKMIEIFRYSNRTTDGKEMLWALYAENCLDDFKYEANEPLTRPDSVNCIEFPRLENYTLNPFGFCYHS